MGRTSDKIWQHWDATDNNKVNCRYCKSSQQQKHAPKCKRHTSICMKTPLDIRRLFRDELHNIKQDSRIVHSNSKKSNSSEPISMTTSNSMTMDEEIEMIEAENADNPDTPAGSSFSSKPAIPAVLDKTINKLSRALLKELEILFAKAMISGNVPDSWLGNYFLRLFFTKLGSGFHPPTRRQLQGSILRQLEEESDAIIGNEIASQKNLTMVPDGWQNIRGSSIINIMLVNPRCSIFYKSIETGNTISA